MIWISSNRYASCWVQGGFFRTEFHCGRFSAISVPVLQSAHPPLHPKCLLQVLTCCFLEKKAKKRQNKIQVSTCLKSHVLQSLVIQSKNRTEPCDKKVTIPTCESGGWIITWGKGWACCSFVLNHSCSSMGAPLPRLESSQGVSDDPKSRWIIPPVNPYLG